MYSIYAFLGLNSETPELVYDPTRIEDGYVVTDATFINRIDGAGEASFTIPPTHPLYSNIHKIKTHIMIKNDNKVVWYGRVFSVRRNFLNCKTIICEGSMAFLNDICLAPYRYYEKNPNYGQPDEEEYIVVPKTISDHITYIMDVYNTRAHPSRNVSFSIGTAIELQVGRIVEGCDSYNSVLTEIKNQVGELNYHFTMGFSGFSSGGRPIVNMSLDKLPLGTCSQTIEFGKNLLDFEEYLNAESAYGCIIPVGSDDSNCFDDNGVSQIDSKVPLKDRSYYVAGNTSEYGAIDKVINFEYISDPAALRSAAENIFSLGGGKPAVEFTLKAVDMHLLDVNESEFKLGYAVRVKSAPHGLDKDFIVTEISINMLKPESNTYTFSDTNLQSPETFVDQYYGLKIYTNNQLGKKVTTGRGYGIVSMDVDSFNLILDMPKEVDGGDSSGGTKV